VLFAGGFDGEAVSGPVFLAELLRRAALRPKLSPTARLPVVYAGNARARALVEETLGDRYLLRAVENLRPSSGEERLEEARGAIHDLFMDHVMSHAPGYGALRDWVEAPILPTPAALGRILEIVTAGSDRTVLVVDVGGATTDVFTARGGEVFRTVSANLGMSYSALHVASLDDLATVRSSLPEDRTATEIWNRIGEKHLRPTRLPPTEEDVRVEWALATAAVRAAVRDHIAVRGGARLSRSTEELKVGWRWSWKKRARRDPLPLEGYDLVIGSGGILSHSPRAAAATILTNALEPRGRVDLAVDRAFILPHLGAIGTVAPEIARELFEAVAVVPLGPLVAPVVSAGRRAGPVRIELPDRTAHDVPLGEVARIERKGGPRETVRLYGASLSLSPASAELAAGELGVLLDARPRPLEDRRTSFFAGPVEPPPARPETATLEPVFRGTLRERRELADAGEVLVESGERVDPDTPVARHTELFLRPFFVDVAVPLRIEPDEVAGYLRFEPGDEIDVGDLLAERARGVWRSTLRCVSPVAGTVDRILPDGTVVLRERPETARGLVAVQAARDLDVEPSKLPPYLTIRVGQRVERNQAVARELGPHGITASRSPIRGTVASIDEDFGIVHVTPLREELEIRAWLPGVVAEVTARGAIVEAPGVLVTGAWGRGREAAGPLVVDRPEEGAVVVLTAPEAGRLAETLEARPAALVTGGLDLRELRETPGDPPILLTEGFGVRPLPEALASLLGEREGRLALLDGTTELRVGVRRPRLLLPDPRED
jgi:uncharacterized protein (TIGR01319 family)